MVSPAEDSICQNNPSSFGAGVPELREHLIKLDEEIPLENPGVGDEKSLPAEQQIEALRQEVAGLRARLTTI
ncbi:hypothetical protein J2Y63_006661 [Shinella sp. BE166]|uniref:hypothetical protein n=1 Tax=Shinella sp. BE166 TaxID=3373918 RepID=UPI003EC086A3